MQDKLYVDIFGEIAPRFLALSVKTQPLKIKTVFRINFITMQCKNLSTFAQRTPGTQPLTFLFRKKPHHVTTYYYGEEAPGHPSLIASYSFVVRGRP